MRPDAGYCGPDSLICNPEQTLTLLAGGCIDSIYNWYDAAVGGILLNSGNIYSPEAIGQTTIYYVFCEFNDFTTDRSEFTVYFYETPCPCIPEYQDCSGGDLIAFG